MLFITFCDVFRRTKTLFGTMMNVAIWTVKVMLLLEGKRFSTEPNSFKSLN